MSGFREQGDQGTAALAAECEAARAEILALKQRLDSEQRLRFGLQCAEQSLREHEARWLFAIEGTGVGVLDWDVRGGEMTLSDRWLSITGYSRSEVSSNSQFLLSLIHPEDLPTAWADVQEVLSGRKAVHAIEHRLKHRQGHWIWIQARSLVTAWSENHEPLRMIGTHVDITERKLAEEALRETEMRFRVLADGAPLPIFVADASGGTQFVNQTYRDFFGVAPEQAEGGKWHPVVHPDDAPSYLGRFRGAVQARAAFQAELRVRRADGEWRMVETFARPRTSPAGEYLGHVGIIIDLTERKQAEQEQVRLQSQLLHAQKIDSVGRLAGGVAHDFNNMLGVILGRVELALERAGSDLLRDDLREVRNAAQRSAELTRQLLAFARKQPNLPQLLNLNDSVEPTLAMVRRLIGENIQLCWQSTPDLWRVKMDPAQIDQVLTNLCINARDAIGQVGTIDIRASNCSFDDEQCAAGSGRVPGDYVRLTVSDDGCGMDQQTQAHLFEPFFTTKGVGQGTGLGLATVHGIVTQHHGFITVTSEPHVGTTFEIYLPRRDGDEPVSAAPKTVVGAPLSSNETILLVEDEPALLTIVQSMLEQSGYTVLAANSPRAALRLADEHSGRIDLLLTDVVMPELSGPRLAEQLGQKTPGLKQLFMSGYTSELIAQHGMLEQGLRFLEKPFSGHALISAVRAVLEA